MPLNKQSRGWGFDTSWRSCGITGITMLDNAISVSQRFRPQLHCLVISFALSHDMLFSKLSSERWFWTPWRSCRVTAMTMLQNSISVLQMISSANKVFGYLFCSQSWHAVEQIVKRTVISDAMALIWSRCNDNAAKRDFGITNDYVSNERE